MDTKLTQVAQAMIDALQVGKTMDAFIDSTDSHPTMGVGIPGAGPGDDTACSFTMSKDVDVPRRTPRSSHLPLGRIVYTVTVVGKYEPFEEE